MILKKQILFIILLVLLVIFVGTIAGKILFLILLSVGIAKSSKPRGLLMIGCLLLTFLIVSAFVINVNFGVKLVDKKYVFVNLYAHIKSVMSIIFVMYACVVCSLLKVNLNKNSDKLVLIGWGISVADLIYITFYGANTGLIFNEKGLAASACLCLCFLHTSNQLFYKSKLLTITLILVLFSGALRVLILLILAYAPRLYMKKTGYRLISFIFLCGITYFMWDEIQNRLEAFKGGIAFEEHANNQMYPVGRYAAIYLARVAFLNVPLFGFGYGMYHSFYGEILTLSPVFDVDYSGFGMMENYVEVGAFGLMLYLVIFSVILYKLNRSQGLYAGVFIPIILWLMHTPTDVSMYVQWYCILYVLCECKRYKKLGSF